MERLPILNKKIEKDGLYLLNCSSINEPSSFVLNQNGNFDILIVNLSDKNEIHFDIEDGAFLHLSCLSRNKLNSFKISANVGKNAKIDAFFADFIKGQCKGEVVINLNKENASVDWRLASLTCSGDKKVFDVSSFHKATNTISHLDNYGVIRDDGKLQFSGICKIENGSHGSKAHQNAKIMVFDEASDGIAKPILKIDDNDIEASHAAVVGKINDEHVFYLTSRGLSKEEAKRIITLGYLKPILNGFRDENVRNEIEKIIEGNM